MPSCTMEFDWIDAPFDLKKVTPSEVEEAFEDPFSLRLLPDIETIGGHARYVCLGRTLKNRPLFSVFWTDGKNYRVILSREMTSDEVQFYDRKNMESLF